MWTNRMVDQLVSLSSTEDHSETYEDNAGENENRSQHAIRAAIYARISSPNQKSNSSIHEQIAHCRTYVSQKGWMTRYIFFDEESGKTVDRPKFQLMLEKARQRCFDVIVFWKLDRFCRSLVDLVNVERNLREYGVGLSSVTEYVDTTSSIGRFNFRSIGSVAELERELIGERARLGLHALAKEDRWPNPHPPLGYCKKENGKLMVNQEAELVLRIFGKYSATHALPQVAFDLNEKGILTKHDKKWNATAVRNILTNEIYIGRYSVAGVSHYLEDLRIMSDDLFFQVQKALMRYKAGKARRPPMPEIRRNAEIDRVFNQFLMHLNPIEESQAERSSHNVKTLSNEKTLLKLINDGWDLIKVVGEEFTVSRPVSKPRRGLTSSVSGLSSPHKNDQVPQQILRDFV